MGIGKCSRMYGAFISKFFKFVVGELYGKSNIEDVIRLDLDLSGRFRVIR